MSVAPSHTFPRAVASHDWLPRCATNPWCLTPLAAAEAQGRRRRQVTSAWGGDTL